MAAGHPLGGTGAIVTGFTACALRVFFGNGITRMIPLAPAGIPIGIPAQRFLQGWIPIEFSSYFGGIVETPYLIFDPEIQKRSFLETEKLVAGLVGKGFSFERTETGRGHYIIQCIPKAIIVEYIRHLKISKYSSDFSTSQIAEFLENTTDKSIDLFDIAFMEGKLTNDETLNVDWRQRALHIQRNVVKLSRQPILVKEPKTRAGVRVVYLSKDLCKLLHAWEKECQWEKEQQGAGVLTQEDYLFRQPNGDPTVPCTFTFRFKKILRENGLPDNLNVHSLRHTNASMLIAQGVDVRTVAGLLGHSQPSTTLDFYSHVFDKNKRLAGQKLSEAMGL